jgi:3,4-dihydroxy 2-butanone 4-phosphate synthase/GTP cyclohydrolase II
MTSPTDRLPDVDAAREAAAALANGGFVVLAESGLDEAEGNLMLAAQFVTSAAIAVLTTFGHGVVRLCLTDERCDELGLRPQVTTEESWQPTASIAHRSATGRGASNEDRARTIQAAIDPASGRSDFVPGGYVFPLRARPGGVLRRSGRTEAAVDLARLAGCLPAVAMSLVMSEDGTIPRGPGLRASADELGYPFVTVDDVVALRRRTETLVERQTTVRLPTRHGEFSAVGFRDRVTGAQHLALVKGDVAAADAVLVRVHAECILGDVFGAGTCNCSAEVANSLELINERGCGVLLYLVSSNRERRLTRHGEDELGGTTATMDEYGIGAQILADLGLRRIRLLTNHARLIPGLDGFGLEVVEYLPIALEPSA